MPNWASLFYVEIWENLYVGTTHVRICVRGKPRNDDGERHSHEPVTCTWARNGCKPPLCLVTSQLPGSSWAVFQVHIHYCNEGHTRMLVSFLRLKMSLYTWLAMKLHEGLKSSKAFFPIIKYPRTCRKGSFTRRKIQLQKDGRKWKSSGLSFRWRLLCCPSLCQQRSMNRFKPLVVGRGECRECRLDCFLDSWHATDLVESVLRKLVTTHYPGMLKNLRSKTKGVNTLKNVNNEVNFSVGVVDFMANTVE